MSLEPWPVPPMWRGMRCFVLGSGPSIAYSGVDRIRGAKVIAVNCSVRLAPFADVLFFSDTHWFVRFRREVETFTGMIVTVSEKAASAMPGRARLVSAEYAKGFPPAGSAFIREGKCSGQRAISLAVALGARRIVLLGFDMREIEGETHFHDEYRNDLSRYREHFLPDFTGWNCDAQARGVTIVNATPGSALTEFPVSTVDEELPGLAA